ncbi:MAG TPA: hypothetical protein VFS67_35405 [Polyangiaceae bacterium]|nr:hypothetical protein [Polyangiaceae bacterium]
MTRSLLWTGAWLAAWLLPMALACGSTGVGNPGPAETGTLSLAIVSDDDDTAPEPGSSGPAATDADGSAPVVPLPRGALERAALVIGSVRWLPCDDAEPVITQSGPFLVDLVAGTRPALPAFEVPAGGLCGFDAPLAPAREGGEFLGRSLLFSGTRADGVRFLLFANLRATLRVRAPRGEVWGGAGDQALLWAMRPRRWAAAQELDNEATSDADGPRTLVIDADRHPLLFALIRARLAGQSALFLDRDRDGVLDAEDRSDGQVGTGTTDPEE